MKYDDIVFIFKGRSFSWWIPLIVTANVLTGISAWVIFHGPPPDSIPLDFLWISPGPIVFFYSFTMLIILGGRSSKRPNKRPYNVAMRDLVNRIQCATIMTVLSCWTVVSIFKALLRDLKPLSGEGSEEGWTGVILLGFLTLLFCAFVLATTWLPISADKLGDLYGPVATDGESMKASNHKESKED